MATALEICLGVIVAIFLLGWLYTRMYPVNPPQECNTLSQAGGRYPRETKPKPAKRNLWRREAQARQAPQLWNESREPKAHSVDRRVTTAENSLQKFDVAPSRDWHRTNRMRAQGQGLQQPNVQRGVQTSMLLENQRRAAAAHSGHRARGRRLGFTPTWDLLRGGSSDGDQNPWNQRRCQRWLNNREIQQRPIDHPCWEYSAGSRPGPPPVRQNMSVEERMALRAEYAAGQADASEEYESEQEDADAPFAQSGDAPMRSNQQTVQMQQQLDSETQERLEARRAAAQEQAERAEERERYEELVAMLASGEELNEEQRADFNEYRRNARQRQEQMQREARQRQGRE